MPTNTEQIREYNQRRYNKAFKIKKVAYPDGNNSPVKIDKDNLEDLINTLPNLKTLIIKSIRTYIIIPDFYENIEKTNIRINLA